SQQGITAPRSDKRRRTWEVGHIEGIRAGFVDQTLNTILRILMDIVAEVHGSITGSHAGKLGFNLSTMSEANNIYEWNKNQRGVTLLLAALTMFVVLGMAALAVDVASLYLAKSEAQRSAEAGAMAAARALVAAGVTGDPSNSSDIWQTACAAAIQQAQFVAGQNKVGGAAPSAAQVTVTFPNAPNKTDCSGTNSIFGINPQVAVSVQRNDLPTFFSRIWRKNPITVSSSATAEAFNPSNSGSVGGGQGVPVAPHCVKPWIIPNLDPDPVHGVGSTLFDPTSGAISKPGPYP